VIPLSLKPFLTLAVFRVAAISLYTVPSGALAFLLARGGRTKSLAWVGLNEDLPTIFSHTLLDTPTYTNFSKVPIYPFNETTGAKLQSHFFIFAALQAPLHVSNILGDNIVTQILYRVPKRVGDIQIPQKERNLFLFVSNGYPRGVEEFTQNSPILLQECIIGKFSFQYVGDFKAPAYRSGVSKDPQQGITEVRNRPQPIDGLINATPRFLVVILVVSMLRLNLGSKDDRPLMYAQIPYVEKPVSSDKIHDAFVITILDFDQIVNNLVHLISRIIIPSSWMLIEPIAIQALEGKSDVLAREYYQPINPVHQPIISFDSPYAPVNGALQFIFHIESFV